MRTKPENHQQMLGVADVASRLDVSTKTIRRWIDAGQLHIHRLGRQIKISENDLSTFVAIRRQ